MTARLRRHRQKAAAKKAPEAAAKNAPAKAAKKAPAKKASDEAKGGSQ